MLRTTQIAWLILLLTVSLCCPVVTACPVGDLDGDCGVGWNDLLLFSTKWLDTGLGRVEEDLVTHWDIWSSSLVINEFMASNNSELEDPDEPGEFPDWIEIYNTGNTPINLAGMYITDDLSKPTRWQILDGFPFETTVGGHRPNYLVLLADGEPEQGPLHVDFKLSAGGEEIGLFDTDGSTLINSISFVDQHTDISYGLFPDAGEEWLFMDIPTPGAENNSGYLGEVADTKFSHDRGFYDTPFDVTISCKTEGATIYYTLDCSEPTQSSTEYTAPIAITTTSCLRAKAFKPGWLSTNVDAQTYIFLEDVIHQTTDPPPPGFPDTWVDDIPADYEMDPDIVDDVPVYDKDGLPFDVKDALLAIPTMSLVMDFDDLFDPATGIYKNPGETGIDWERPGSVELFYPDGSDEFQVNCGVRIYGGAGRIPGFAPKHTFRLLFKSDYGPTKLRFPLFGEDAADEFDTIILRAGFNDAWDMIDEDWRGVGHMVQYLRDEWVRASIIDMGSVGSHGMFVHLYINGVYWGLYNPVERPDSAFSASYFGGNKEEWDALHDGEVKEGSIDAWDAAQTMASADLSSNEAYQMIQGNNPDGTPNPEYENLLDVEDLIDYMIINFYAGTRDWDYHNWYAGRRRIDSEGYRIYVWDAEISNGRPDYGDFPHVFELYMTVEDNIDIGFPGHPSFLYQRLRENAEFRMLFADHVHRHLFNDGALTSENTAARYESLTDLIDRAIVGESARWGDSRPPREFDPFTRDDEWIPTRDWLFNIYFPQRTDILLGWFRDALPNSLYPYVDAPVFYINGLYQHGGQIEPTDSLSMTATAGTIWYTLDGNDPRLPAEGGDYVVLLPQGETWKYLDDGSNQGTAWREPSFNDNGWASGLAELGYGDGDEATVVSFGGDVENKYITTYFRHTFNVTDASQYSNLTLKLLRDDGAVVYLNGTEIRRSNILEGGGDIFYDTTADDAAGTEDVWFTYPADPYLLVDGDNVIAVEVHQTSSTSSDISFNLKLVSSEGEPGGVSPTAIEYTSPFTLNKSTQVKARALDGGEWSALNEILAKY